MHLLANICFKNIKFPRGNYQPIVPGQKHYCLNRKGRLRRASTRSPNGDVVSAFWDSPLLLSKLTDKGTNWITDSFKIFIMLQKAEKAKFTRRKGVGWEEFRKRNLNWSFLCGGGGGCNLPSLLAFPPVLFSFSGPHPPRH